MAAEDDILLQFGKRVRELRRKKKLSQEDIGLEADLQQAYVSDVELGRRNISLRNIHAIAKTLGVTLTELFEGWNNAYRQQELRGRGKQRPYTLPLSVLHWQTRRAGRVARNEPGGVPSNSRRTPLSPSRKTGRTF